MKYLTEDPIEEYALDRLQALHLIDWEHPENNEFLAVNQFTVSENNHQRRPDIIIFINGLPLVVLELKNAADPQATVKSAYNQTFIGDTSVDLSFAQQGLQPFFNKIPLLCTEEPKNTATLFIESLMNIINFPTPLETYKDVLLSVKTAVIIC